MADAFLGRDVPVYIALQATKPTTAAATQYIRWGGCRDRSWGPELDTVDATSDTSSGVYRQSLPTYATNQPELSGVLTKVLSDNLDDIEDYLNDKTNAGESAEVWVKVFRPCSKELTPYKYFEFPANLTKFMTSATYDDIVTWEASLEGTGPIDSGYGTSNSPQNVTPP